MKIAAVCMTALPGEVERNLDRTQSFVRSAVDQGAEIICFPELSITGYVLHDPGAVYSRALAEEAVERVVEWAVQENVILLAGLIERPDREKPYICQIVAGPEGLVGIYRKTHLSPTEKAAYSPGQELAVFDSRGIRFGVQLCYESHFPEISTIMALKGADIIFMPHASPRGTPEEKRRSWLRHLPGRAFDNAVFIVACNQVGGAPEGFSFPGVAVALNPAGRMIARYQGEREKLVFAEMEMGDLKEIREHRMKYFLPNRRPELYDPICSG